MSTSLTFSRRTCAALFVALLLAPFFLARGADAKPSLQSQAIALFQSLTPDQRAKALLPYDSPERNAELYPGGPRPGVQLKALDEKQRAAAVALLKSFTSDYGAKKCEAIAAQTPNPGEEAGLNKYYLAFFGEPGAGKTYAWRIAEHHLTIVHLEVEKGEPSSFGPILLGANPPTLWDEDEDAMIALYAVMSPPERQKAAREGPAIASKPMEGEGLRVSELSPTAQEKVKVVYENRLKFFSDEVRQRIGKIAESNGGLGAMRVAFYGVADKRCRDGGKWDFKLGGTNFLCDYENQRKHIHMSMKGKLAEGKQ
ncbi:MAG: DUF3500 domain-containing protein [Tepidisphaeraceae bacterium]